MIGEPEYYPIEIGSNTLKKAFANLDEDIIDLELRNKSLINTNKELEKKLHDQLSATMNAQQASIAATLAACLGAPDLTSMGTVGATVLIRIKEMTDIKQVHAYIQEIIENEKKK